MSTRSSTVILVTLFCLVAPVAGFAGVASAADNPRFETDVPEPVLQPGSTQTLTVELTNNAEDYDDDVETAYEIEVAAQDTDHIDVQSGTRKIGNLGNDATKTVSVQIDVDANIPGGTHRVPLEVTYRDQDDRDETVTKTVYAEVRVKERARFEISDVDSQAIVGASGTVSMTVTNVGETAASNAVLALQSANSDLTFGKAATTRRYLGELTPNESTRVEVDATFTSSAETRAYAVDGTIEYETPGGSSTESRPLSFGVTPLPEQSFTVGNIQSTLRVGEDGKLRLNVTNTGTQTVTNAVVRFSTNNPNISPLEPEVAVGRLRANQTKEVVFDIEVTGAAEAGTRQFESSVQYRDAEGTQRVSDPLDVPARVGPSRDEFGVEPVSGTLEVGSSGTLTLSVTNNRESPVSDVSAKLFLDSPLSSSNDEGFIAELGPGETQQIKFALAVDGGALGAKTYPAKVDFRYETAEGDSKISDTYQVPVQVTEPTDDGLPLPLIGGVVALLLVLVGAGYYYRKR